MKDDVIFEDTWETRRQHLVKLLSDLKDGADLKLLMVEMKYPYKDMLIEDLRVLAKSLRKENKQLLVQPSMCLGCGFVFTPDKDQFKIPTKCPKCRQERISWPRAKIMDL